MPNTLIHIRTQEGLKMIKLTGLIVMSALFISACNTDEETSDSEAEVVIETDAEGNILSDGDTDIIDGDSEEEVDTDFETEEDTDIDSELSGTEEEDTNEAVDLSIVMDQDFEDIDWNDVHLTRNEFDSSLLELQHNFNEDYEEDEEIDVTIDSIDFSGDTLEITLTNNDDSGFAEMTNGFLAVILDSFYRQLYLHSDYSDGDTHPHIIVQTSDGEVITDQEDFIEFEE